MSIRLVVSIHAAAGKGNERAEVTKGRLSSVRQEPGCEQYDLYQSIENPDELVLLERWTDQASLDVHSQLNRTRPPNPPELQGAPSTMERYEA